MTNFSPVETDQVDSFPAQMARQMGVDFTQPLIQAPGLGGCPGLPAVTGAAARVLKVPAPTVAALYGLLADDRISVDGLTEMGY